jgi:hypothetical protein
MMMTMCVAIVLALVVMAVPVVSVAMYYCFRGFAKTTPQVAQAVGMAFTASTRH